MARVVFFALLLLNLLALGGLAGWLGGSRSDGEPERLTNQLRPEAIELVALDRLPPEVPEPAPEPIVPEPSEPPLPVPEPAPPPELAAPPPAPEVAAAVPVPRACIRFIELTEALANELTTMTKAFDEPLDLADSAVLRPTSYWVHVPPLDSRRAADRKVQEIRSQGVRDLFILQEEGPFQFAISLGLFKTESSAQLHLRRLEARGVTGGTITARGNMIHRLEVRGPVDVLATLASDSAARFEGLEREPCEP
ncbi:MAG: SPOR domain-containing protein [Zoogloeaceae bacterium]|nr:SPOR domain-containing protein [Rhodocyclaceae bacterium]MCP5234683.1 SPOR domain-containing protein [Zoogloeaceae bacterium]